MRRELEEDRVETELELVLPLLDLLIRGSGIREGLESAPGLVIGDNEPLVVHDFHAIDLPGQLDTLSRDRSLLRPVS